MRRVSGQLRESNCRRSHCREALICMQFLGYYIYISMLFLRDLLILWEAKYVELTQRSDIRPLYRKVALKRSKTMKNSKTEDRLPEVSILKLSGKILVSREVVALGGSIVHVYNTYCTVFLSLSFSCFLVGLLKLRPGLLCSRSLSCHATEPCLTRQRIGRRQEP